MNIVKLLSEPAEDWVLVRVPKMTASAAALALVEKRNGTNVIVERGERENTGVVVAAGPGARNEITKEVVPLDPRCVPGRPILFMGKTRQRPDDFREEMERENLWLIPAGAVIAYLFAEELSGVLAT